MLKLGGVMTIIDRLLIGILALGIWALVATQLTSTVDAAVVQDGTITSPIYVNVADWQAGPLECRVTNEVQAHVNNMYEISLYLD